MNTLDLIRNAKDGSYVDFRTADNQIDSVPIAEIRELLEWADVALVKAEFERPFSTTSVVKGTSLADLYPNGVIADSNGNIHEP